MLQVSSITNRDDDDDDDISSGGVEAMVLTNDSDRDNDIVRKRCFTSVQTHRFWVPLVSQTCRLCPSMDLMVFGLQTTMSQQQHQQQQSPHLSSGVGSGVGAATIWLHRTVSWQKLSCIQPTTTADDATTSPATTANTTNVTTTTGQRQRSPSLVQDDAPVVVTHACWSPDGRILAAADTRSRITLHPVESMLSLHHQGGGGLVDGTSSTGSTCRDQSVALSLLQTARTTTSTSTPTATATATATATTVGLLWAHVGRPHPGWSLTENEVEHLICWKYRRRYLDRALHFLPPSEYHQHHYYADKHQAYGGSGAGITDNNNNIGTGGSGNNGIEGTSSNDNMSAWALPTCQTPLSLFCVATAEHGLNLYLHGRYPILRNLEYYKCKYHNSDATRTPTSQQKSMHETATTTTASQVVNTASQVVNMVASTDLTHLLVHCEGSSQLTLYSIPALSRHRYDLQSISALYCSMTEHVKVIQTSVTEIAASWKSSLKPLDLKLDGLTKLLQNYGLIDGFTNNNNNNNNNNNRNSDDRSNRIIKGHLVHYILAGHNTRTSPNLANAMDQFFTGVQMNDQLLQRMGRSLTVAVANVERQVRKSLLAPATALVYQANEAHGLAAAGASMNEDEADGVLLPEAAARELQCRAEGLLVSVESSLTELIDARFRLRDLVAWLRSTGSQIKARGTAANSVQRDNAKQRRVPNAVVQRMLRYLQSDFEHEQVQQQDQGDPTMQQPTTTAPQQPAPAKSITETILGLQFSLLLQQSEMPSSTTGTCSRTNVVAWPRRRAQGSSSPRSVRHQHGEVHPDGDDRKRQGFASLLSTTQTVPFAAQATMQAAVQLFENPPHYIGQSVQRTRFCLHDPATCNDDNSVGPVAITTRIGCGDMDVDGGSLLLGDAFAAMDNQQPDHHKAEGFFSPKQLADTQQRNDNDVDNGGKSTMMEHRQWSLVAQRVCCHGLEAGNTEQKGNNFERTTTTTTARSPGNDDDSTCCVQLHAIPLSWTEAAQQQDEWDDEPLGMAAPYYWTTLLVLPSNCSVQDICFYGDDGKSSLSAGVDSGTGKERRQALGLLVARDNGSHAQTFALELWLVSYDDLVFHRVAVDSNNNGETENGNGPLSLHMSVSDYHESSRALVEAMPDSYNGDDDEDDEDAEGPPKGVVYAKTREVSTLEARDLESSSSGRTTSKLVLCGSRGIGAVFTSFHQQPGGTTLDLLDLEEDEEADSDVQSMEAEV